MIPAQTTLVPARDGRAGPALDGLTLAEARERAAAGQVNAVPAAPGRSLGQILRANLCTRFNAILGTLFGVVLVVGPPQDALFGLVLAANTAIGVAQELRAKRTLDRLAVLTAARARVVRDGTATEIGVEEIVRDDLSHPAAGRPGRGGRRGRQVRRARSRWVPDSAGKPSR